MSADGALACFEQQRARYLEDLATLVRIPGISLPGFDAAEVRRSAQATAGLLRARGFADVELLEAPGAHPSVYGEMRVSPSAPTLLLYAHHDVLPPGDSAKWRSPPFEPTVRDDRMYGRGAADDKAGIVVLAAAAECWSRQPGGVPLNLKILVDGEEEAGSTHLRALLQSHRRRLAADAIVLTDTANFETGLPSITTSLRGLVGVEIEVRATASVSASDAALGLCKMLASLSDERGRILIDGLYDRVRPPTEAERRDLAALPGCALSFRAQAELLDGVTLLGGANPWYESWRLPSLAINALDASWARVGIRIVPDLEPQWVLRQLADKLRAAAPSGLDVKIDEIGAAGWWRAETSHPAHDAARRALAKGYGRAAVAIGCGGSIPFVGAFAAEFPAVPMLLIGVEDPLSNAHSENESLHLGDWQRAVRSTIHLYQELAAVLG